MLENGEFIQLGGFHKENILISALGPDDGLVVEFPLTEFKTAEIDLLRRKNHEKWDHMKTLETPTAGVTV